MSGASTSSVLRFEPGDFPLEPSCALPDWATRSPSGVGFVADDSGCRQIFVFSSDKLVLAGISAEDVVSEASKTADLGISQFAISHVLQTGFVPMTSTVFTGLQRLGMGDSVAVTIEAGRFVLQGRSEYPWIAARSRQDQEPDTKRLGGLIAASVERNLAAAGGSAVLMMSSGKDSAGLAIALADGGHDVPCFTYQHTDRDPEPVYAKRFCDRLGLTHRTIELPRDPEVVRASLLRFFAGSVFPSVDHALIPVVTIAAASGLSAGGLIDGGGNDTYMTYLPGRTRRMKELLRVRWRPAADRIRRTARVDSPVNYLARSEASIFFPGRNLRYREVAGIYAGAIDASDHWYGISAATSHFGRVDAVGVRLVREAEGSRSNDKVRLAAAAYGLTPMLPYMDEDLSDYYFHLPLAARYDESAGRSKLLLRQWLDERLDYAASGVGDGHFSFEGAHFVEANAPFVRDEIFGCALWDPAVRAMVDDWMDKLPRRPFLWHALLALFLVSGWHNHSQYVRR